MELEVWLAEADTTINPTVLTADLTPNWKGLSDD